MVEQHALDLVSTGEHFEACRFLLQAAQATPVFGLKTSMRLFDLLAGLTVRFKMPNERGALVNIVQAEIARVSSLESKSQPPQSSGVLAVMYRLAGNEPIEPPAAGRNARVKRHHEQHKQKHNRTSKLISPHARVAHNEFLRTAAEERLRKWKRTDTNWYHRWSARQPVKWGATVIK